MQGIATKYEVLSQTLSDVLRRKNEQDLNGMVLMAKQLRDNQLEAETYSRQLENINKDMTAQRQFRLRRFGLETE